jgi:uncharacterized repeat protein (TIGR01451 family)
MKIYPKIFQTVLIGAITFGIFSVEGNAYVVEIYGTIDSTPRTNITLRNGEASVLVKADVYQPISLTKQVDKTQASSGETLTYTISCRNISEDQTYTNIKIEDPIPARTTYVLGSAKLNGVSKINAQDEDEFRYDSANKKVIWNLGGLAPGASGSVQFQVRIL